MDNALSFESFLASAQKAAHRAMADHARREYDEFALHAGVSVEHLGKAVLVSMNPIYIAEMKGSTEMLFHLGGHHEAKKVRTIGASEAIARLRTLQILTADKELDNLIDIRNGVAHASAGDGAKELLPTLATTVEALLKGLPRPPEGFWGIWTSAVNVAVDKKRSEIQKDVEIRIKQARHLFDERFQGLPESIKETILAAPWHTGGAFDPKVVREPHEEGIYMLSMTPCPACGGNASLSLAPLGRLGSGINMVPDSFACRLCGLELNSAEEVSASGADIEKAALPSSLVIGFDPTLAHDLHLGETHTG